MPTIRDNLDRLGTDIIYIRNRAPQAVRAMHDSDREHDGYPHTASGADRQRGGNAELNSVEAAASHRSNSTAAQHQLSTLIRHAVDVVGKIVTVVDRWAPAPERATTARCSGGAGLPGNLQWGRADCDNIGTSRRKGLCDSCYQRQRRWETRTTTGEH